MGIQYSNHPAGLVRQYYNDTEILTPEGWKKIEDPKLLKSIQQDSAAITKEAFERLYSQKKVSFLKPDRIRPALNRSINFIPKRSFSSCRVSLFLKLVRKIPK